MGFVPPPGPDSASPSPHGEGGLKYAALPGGILQQLSLPAWGGWIEITWYNRHLGRCLRPSPHGEGGLK